MIAEWTTGQWLEGAMLVCFGLSWPISIYKTWRARRADGKSLRFLSLVFCGYLAGIAAKFVRAAGGWPEPVTVLYAMNASFVAADIVLCARLRREAARVRRAALTDPSPRPSDPDTSRAGG